MIQSRPESIPFSASCIAAPYTLSFRSCDSFGQGGGDSSTDLLQGIEFNTEAVVTSVSRRITGPGPYSNRGEGQWTTVDEVSLEVELASFFSGTR